MKNGKRLTRAEKIAVQANGLNPDNWLRIKSFPDSLLIIHREAKVTKLISKGRSK